MGFSESSCFTIDRSFLIYPPWDILRGRDVLKDTPTLEEELGKSDLKHFAPNCATFSRAREIPIKGVTSPARPVRSETYPFGIPHEMSKMSKKSRKRIELDTEMADLSAQYSLDSHKEGKGFTLEHPGNSIALHLDSWKKLLESEGVERINYHTCMFEGSRRRKFQVLITNRKCFRKLGLLCNGGRVCDRTGERHYNWRPLVSEGRVLQFTTGDEREYPRGFCDQYALCLKEIAPPIRSFVEIFSGPNAPLSRSISELFSVDLPGAKMASRGKGLTNELQKLAEVMDPGLDSSYVLQVGSSTVNKRVESKFHREAGVNSGRQPGYGKRTPLVPDGLNDPICHMKEALKLQHPFTGNQSLKVVHQEVLDSVSPVEAVRKSEMVQALARWKAMSTDSEVSSLQKEHEKLASETSKKLGRKPRTALMEILGNNLSVPDMAVPRLCLTGMPIIGDALESPFFDKYEVPAKITISELLRTAPSRRETLLRRVERMSKLGGQPQCEAIWKKTLKEVSAGSMAGPFTVDQVVERHGKHFNLVPSFGLQQGYTEDGSLKYRRIDDHSASLNNAAATRKQRIDMAMADYVVVLVKAAFQKFGKSIHLATEDMQGAYRQVPLPDSHVSISITAVTEPASMRAHLFELYGQPFGAAHAVPNFYRVSEFLCQLILKQFKLLLDHFFDDFFVATPSTDAELTRFIIKEAFGLLGFVLDAEKSQPPAEFCNILGVVFCTASLSSQKILSVQPKASRRENFSFLVNKILQDSYLPPSLAASVLGKFGFLCSTMFGKLGRACTGPLRQRQYSQSADCTLNPALIYSLQLMKQLVQTAPSRTFLLQDSKPPLILYTDASDVPGRCAGRAILGAVLIDPLEGFDISYTYWIVPDEILTRWCPRQTYMFPLEIMAGPLAMITWKSKVSDRHIIHFIDNDGAASSLVRGYSPAVDSAQLVAEYWLHSAQARAFVYIDRVESKSNLADGPSRLDFTLMRSLHATFYEPVPVEVPLFHGGVAVKPYSPAVGHQHT